MIRHVHFELYVINLKPLQILNLLHMILQSSGQRIICPTPEELHQLQTINSFEFVQRERIADKAELAKHQCTIIIYHPQSI